MNPFYLPHLHLPSTRIKSFLSGAWETVSPALKSVYNRWYIQNQFLKFRKDKIKKIIVQNK